MTPWEEKDLELFASLAPDLIDQYHGQLVQRLIAYALANRIVRRTPSAAHPLAARTSLVRRELRSVRACMRRHGIAFTETPAKHLRIMAGLPASDRIPFRIFEQKNHA